jgi:aspartate/methionine/tyrosine aminotransferase
LTETIAAHALAHRSAILGRLGEVASGNLALLTRFMNAHGERLCWAPPAGGTTCFPWMRDDRDARPLSEALAKAGVLIAPGDCFDMPAHFRLGFGALRTGYAAALDIFAQVLTQS